MRQIDPDLIARIDVFLALLGLALLIAIFYLIALNLVIGIVCFVTVMSTIGVGIKGYRESSPDTEETT